MPELPEVEAARRAIEENCISKKIIKAVVADDSKVIDSVSPSDFEASLVGKTILSANRKGKNLWLHLDAPPFPSFQFGMAGAIYIKGVAVTKYKRSAVSDTDDWPSKYSKLFIKLDDGLELSFTDKRRFAKVRLLKDPASVPPISELGPDALLEPMTVDELTQSLSKKKTTIKALLLDQSYISGIGNWIADEVLYQARIHPQQIASSLSKESCAALHKCIKEVIEKSIEVGADSSQFPSNWIFHSREKKPGKAFVDGMKIDFITAGGRTTAYVPELQKLIGNQMVKIQAKPGRKNSKSKGVGDDSNDEENLNDPTSEEEITGNAKSKKGQKNGGGSKKPTQKAQAKPSKQILNSRRVVGDNNDADSNDEHENEEEIAKSKKGPDARGGSKKPAQKRKSKGSDDEDDTGDQKKAEKVTNKGRKKAEQTPEKMKPNKKAK